jgi:hypothetical protein
MNRYLVCSREYSYCEPVTDEGQGPWVPVRDVVAVEARNRREARVLGLRQLRKLRSFYQWCDSSENPFAGMLIESDILA